MVSIVVSRELFKENCVAYASTSNTAIHAVKSFHKNLTQCQMKDLKINAMNVAGTMM